MAQYVFKTHGKLTNLIDYVDKAVLKGSFSASLEETYMSDDGTFAMRSYERYSAFGQNRVSLTVSMCDHGTHLELVAMAAGGSQAVFFKINRFGEDSFLSNLERSLKDYIPQ